MRQTPPSSAIRRLSSCLSVLCPLSSVLLFSILFSCALAPRGGEFAGYADKPIPIEAAGWLAGGEQSRVSPRIEKVARVIDCTGRRECLYKAVDLFWKRFHYDSFLNDQAFARTADALFETRQLGGCSDFALAQVALFRALKIPARMVMTANVDWMKRFQQNDLFIPTGHVFIEAWLEDGWHLVDSTYRYLYTEYDMGSKSYPRKEYFCFRVRDYWEAGIRSVADLDAVYGPIARRFDPAGYSPVEYGKVKIE